MIILEKIIKSSNPKYKYDAYFIKDGKQLTTSFGAKGYSDYTIHNDKKRRNNYWKRHLKDLLTYDPTRAGYLSFFILWMEPTIEKSIEEYKKRLNNYNKNNNINDFFNI